MGLAVVDLRGRGEALPPRRLGIDPGVAAAVRGIIDRVREEGDRALFELTVRFDAADLRATGLVVSHEDLDRADRAVPGQVKSAVDAMIERVRDLHVRQMPPEWWAEESGVRFGEVVRPLRRVGCYVPGGRAAYPSTVAMTVVPAAVAGVEEITVTTPPGPDGSLPPAVLYAAGRSGANRVVKVGGAQAIAALAYGTESVAPVDKIVGPGNVYVTAAKREVSGDVGIDGLAGPTELVVVADDTADPEFLAADLVAQAEHDPLAAATLVTTEDRVAARADEALRREVARSGRRDVVSSALEHARGIVVSDEEQAARVVNDLAPEHLQILLADPRAFLARVRNAGAIFLGPWSAVPFGDYGVGSNHVLPTMGTARFSSGLRTLDFVTVSSVVELDAAAVRGLAPQVAAIARSEGLVGHARAAEIRATRAGEGGGR
jgi:histidinol dehydrogenase